MLPVVIYSHNGGNAQRVADIVAGKLACPLYTVTAAPDVSQYSPIIFVIPNRGDEELPAQVEDYLCGLTVRGKPYHLCELGSFFGLEEYKGCKVVIERLLWSLGWSVLSVVSVDSTPTVDMAAVEGWLNGIIAD